MSIEGSDYFSNLPAEDKMLIRKLADWINASERNFSVKFSFFLDERQCFLLEKYLLSIKYHNYRYNGGYNGAERRVLAVYPEYYELDDSVIPIKAIAFEFRDEDKLSHRDFLGALMACQIKREVIGDIVVSQGKAIVFVYDTVCDYIMNNVSKIGSCGVNASLCTEVDIDEERSFTEISGTVASLRLDCVVSLALKLSREKTAELIKSKGTDVNHMNFKNPSAPLKVGDVFSIRGFGRFKFVSISGLSKKERYCIHIYKFI